MSDLLAVSIHNGYKWSSIVLENCSLQASKDLDKGTRLAS